MANLHPTRQRAWEMHKRIRGITDAADGLLPADSLLHLASRTTGLRCYPLPPGDPLLAGARAVLLRDHEAIYYASGGPGKEAARLQRFSLAHEFAHVWLHAAERHVFDCTDDELAQLLQAPADGASEIAQGYSPAERRETEANAFAAEFLLPAPLLRGAFVDRGLTLSQIVELTGVTEAVVAAQLALAALLPPMYAETDVNPSPVNGSGRARLPSGGGLAPLLDADQAAAARLLKGPALVDAGPGTGKTRTLVARAEHLLVDLGIEPGRLLALTFSNRAAEEMQSRLRERVGAPADQIWIGTFHAFGYEILRKDGHRIGLPNRPELLQTADAVRLLLAHVDRLGLREMEYLSDPSLPFPDILRCISRAKDACAGPEAYRLLAENELRAAATEEDRVRAARSAEVAAVYDVYERLKRDQGLVDFGDLIMRAVELLDAAPDAAARWRAAYTHVLADEFQDVNRGCAYLLKRLVGPGAGFWAVGDPRQAIYRFRGASPANVREFDHDFPEGTRMRLGVNYRSRASIVGLVGCFAATMAGESTGVEGPGASRTSWRATRLDTPEPSVRFDEAADEDAQADGIAAAIRGYRAAGADLCDQAILVCTNAQAADLALRLRARGVSVQQSGPLFEREEVKDMLALLALLCDPAGTTLGRVGRFPAYRISAEDIAALREHAAEVRKPFPEALGEATAAPGISDDGRAGFRLLHDEISPLRDGASAYSMLARYLFERSGYLKAILADHSPEGVHGLLGLAQLLNYAKSVALRASRDEGETGLESFLRSIRELILCGEARSAAAPVPGGVLDAAPIMTVHQSKGLEYKVVYLPNLNHGMFPARGSGSMVAPPAELLEEEGAGGETDGAECLFFVALSRARDHLHLSRPLLRNGKETRLSPLLERILPDVPTRTAAGGAGGSPAPVGAASQPALPLPPAELDLALWQVDLYRECPRRYFYSQVERVPFEESRSPYQLFHASLKEATDWLALARERGEPSFEEGRRRLAEVLARHGLDTSSGENRMLRARAEAFLKAAYENGAGAVAASVPVQLKAMLGNGAITVPREGAELLHDGTIRVTRRHRRRLKKDDHTDERLALIRRAALDSNPGQAVEIALLSLADGEMRDVKPNARFEPARVEKYNAALAGIRAGRFEPDPDDRKCGRCPFLFLCPS